MIKPLLKNLLCFVACFSSTLIHAEESPRIVTHITLNGIATKAYFNDGDTFKILDGELKNSRVRVEGFNTLETYGPVHTWIDNDPDYLFSVANEATMRAQNGVWTCETDGNKDTYGRLLAVCHDLALDLIGDGLAHAYSIDDRPARKTYLTSQRAAKSKKVGIWKFGVPEYIITSLHSADEGASKPYNRMISTSDGHTKKWSHRDSYQSCEKVCVSDEASCMVYVPFERRYGNQRPDCLR